MDDSALSFDDIDADRAAWQAEFDHANANADQNDPPPIDFPNNNVNDGKRPWFCLGTSSKVFRDEMLAYRCKTKRCGCWQNAIYPPGGAPKKYGCSIATILENHYENLERLSRLGRLVYESQQLGVMQLGVPIDIAGRKAMGGALRLCAFPFGRLCVPTWCLYMGVGPGRLRRLRKILFQRFPQTTPQQHGLIGRTGNNSRPVGDIDLVVNFVLTSAERLGERHPVRNSSVADAADRLYLPANITRSALHTAYVEWLEKEHPDSKPVSKTTFKRKLRVDHRLRSVVFRPPRSDVCGECTIHKNRLAAQPTALTRFTAEQRVQIENRTRDITKMFKHHIECATEVRDVMNECIEAAKEAFAAHVRNRNDPVELMFTFDYAQNMAIPQMAGQVEPLFFQSLRNYYLFGVRDAAIDTQFNFVYDEAGDFGGRKMSSNVASLVFRLLVETPDTSVQQSRRLPTIIHLFADNFGGQYKNETIMWLLLVLVQSRHPRLKKVREVTLTFTIKGHTRNGVDRGFGVIKKNFVRSNVFTLDQATELIDGLDKQVAIKVHASKFRDFEAFCKQHKFASLPGIQKQQFFRARRELPGVIEFKARRDDEWTTRSLVDEGVRDVLSSFDIDSVEEMERQTLSNLKAYDLHDKVKKYVPEEFWDDFLPEPQPRIRPRTPTVVARRVAVAKGKKAAVASPSSAASSSSSSTSTNTPTTTDDVADESTGLSENADGPSVSRGRRRPRCSECGEYGHNCRSCPRGSSSEPATHAATAAMDESIDSDADSSDSELQYSRPRRKRTRRAAE